MKLFDGFNPFSQIRAKEAMPTEADMQILKKIASLADFRTEKASHLIEDYQDDFDRISGQIDEILNYDLEIPDPVMNAFNSAKETLAIINAGGKIKYRKQRLKEILLSDSFFGNDIAEYMCHFPEDYGRKLDKKGNWIMILDDFSIQNAPKKYSFHFATPKTRNRYMGDMKGSNSYKIWYASIICNNREVLMNPYEYIVVKDIDVILDCVDNGIEMIEGSASARLDKTKVFYLKSRGFTQGEVYRILFKSVTTKGVCHFQADHDISAMYDLIKQGFMPNTAMKIYEHYKNLPTVKFQSV